MPRFLGKIHTGQADSIHVTDRQTDRHTFQASLEVAYESTALCGLKYYFRTCSSIIILHVGEPTRTIG